MKKGEIMTLIVAVFTLLAAAMVVPECRRFFGLEKLDQNQTSDPVGSANQIISTPQESPNNGPFSSISVFPKSPRSKDGMLLPKLGEGYEILLTLKEEGYLRVISIDSDRKPIQLYPNSFQPAKKWSSGKEITLLPRGVSDSEGKPWMIRMATPSINQKGEAVPEDLYVQYSPNPFEIDVPKQEAQNEHPLFRRKGVEASFTSPATKFEQHHVQFQVVSGQ